MPPTLSKPSKTDAIIKAIFGEPCSGFTDGIIPKQRDVAAFYFWLVKVQKGDSPRAKILKDDATAIYWVIANKLMVHWRDEKPDIVQMKKEDVKEKVRKYIVDKVLPVKKRTGLLEDNQIVNLMKEWLKFDDEFDIAKKTKTSESSQVRDTARICAIF